jgi:prepilin-type N-terminal cleavage/methylation domain-containing protein
MGNKAAHGLTLIELLCVIGIIVVLATMLLGPAGRILRRVLADQWSENAEMLLRATVQQLNQHFGGDSTFGLITLDRIESEGLLKPNELQFLKDPRVTFIPFSGTDPDEKIVISVQLKRGFWTDAGVLSEAKQAITHVPQ